MADLLKDINYSIATININGITNKRKLNSLTSFVKLKELDIILLQEVQEENLNLFGFDVIYNISDRKRGTAIAIKSHLPITNTQRNLDGRILKIVINNYITIINVYPPSGTLNRLAREKFFNEDIVPNIENLTDIVILGGDFNCVINEEDSSGNSNYSKNLKQLIKTLNLKDVWNVIHGTKIEHTYQRTYTKSRLDRIYVTQNLESKITSVEVQTNSFSDHHALIAKIKFSKLSQSYGKGNWSLNSNILTKIVLDEFSSKWNYFIKQKKYYKSWMDWWINFTKPKIASFFKWKIGQEYRKFNDSMEFNYYALNRAYKNLDKNPEQKQEINRIKANMIKLQGEFSDFMHKKDEKFLSGEKLSIFQIEQKMKRRSNTNIKELYYDNSSTKNNHEIKAKISDFFEELYGTPNEVCEPDFEKIRPSKKIPDKHINNETLTSKISENEILNNISSSASQKAPGPDGLPREFYLKTWNIIKKEFTEVINEAINGNISEKFVEGTIILVKKKEDCLTAKDFRPISLLNADYKVLSRILKSRMESIMPLIISEHQKCSNRPHNIFEGLMTLIDKIGSINSAKKQGILASFDLDHAFDRVNRKFLKYTLKKMNFNKKFVDLVMEILNKSKSRIIVNGTMTEFINIKNSVRQGDPLSMHLFVIYLQPLIDKMDKIIDKNTETLIAYADDISVITENGKKCEKIVKTIHDFKRVGGAVLNLQKTFGIKLGLDNNINIPIWLNIRERIKILGIYFENNQKSMIQFNWKNINSKLHAFLWINGSRILNIIQKSIMINTYICSKIWFTASILPIAKKYSNEMTTKIRKFLWRFQPQQVAMDQLYLSKLNGGLNLHSIMYKSKALLNNRFLKHSNSVCFAKSFNFQCGVPSRIRIPPHNSLLKCLAQEIPNLPKTFNRSSTTKQIYQHYIEKLPKAKPELQNSNVNWKLVWKNVFGKKLNSKEKSFYFLVVNNKINNNELLNRQNRIDTSNCLHCGENENLGHKLAKCSRLSDLWNECQNRLSQKGIPRTEIEEFLIPELSKLSSTQTTIAMKYIHIYCKFTLENPTVDNDSLEKLKLTFDCEKNTFLY